MVQIPKTQLEWRSALDELPSTPNNIPAFFFAHGSPMLELPMGRDGPLAKFLRDFGPLLLEKYRPKGIVVFSAHWETSGEQLVSDYGDSNPLLMDYYGFPKELYELKFLSRGDSTLTRRVVELLRQVILQQFIDYSRAQHYNQANLSARSSPRSEPRGRDGRGFSGPGLDHGVFIPFRLMFGENFTDIPIVQVSIDESLSPERNWALGKAVAELRREGYLILSGGLTVHNLKNFEYFEEATAPESVVAFDRALLGAISVDDAEERKEALVGLIRHVGFRTAHPREDHFVPVYVAAGAGEGGTVKILNGNYGAPTFAFGL